MLQFVSTVRNFFENSFVGEQFEDSIPPIFPAILFKANCSLAVGRHSNSQHQPPKHTAKSLCTNPRWSTAKGTGSPENNRFGCSQPHPQGTTKGPATNQIEPTTNSMTPKTSTIRK